MITTEVYSTRGVHSKVGLNLDASETDRLAQLVKSLLDDNPTTNDAVDRLMSVESTGFQRGQLEALITIETEDNHYPIWKIGEALSEILLEENFASKFPFSRISTLTNLRSSPGGADLLGLVHNGSGWIFLLGETKTSQEEASPPQIVDSSQAGCLTKQIIKMAKEQNKRKLHIRYLSVEFSRYREQHADFDKFVEAVKSYINDKKYKLVGVVIRDTAAAEDDLNASHRKIGAATECQAVDVDLTALYIPINLTDIRQVVVSI